MTQGTATQEERYLAAFEAFAKNGSAPDPLWINLLRRAAIARFHDLGFPVARRGNEEWKYTDVRPIANTPFHAPASPGGLEAGDLERFTMGQPQWNRLVFVDGHFVKEFSSLPSLPPGVTVADLSEAMVSSSEVVGYHLARHVDYESNAFTALNTAFVHSGAFVHIPDGVLLEEPVHLLFLFTAASRESVSHPRVLVVAGRDSRATIVETYGSLSGGCHFTNGVTEVVVGAGAKVDYYKLQQQGEEAFHITTTQVALARDSNFSSVNVDLGGSVTRNNLNVVMGDEGCSATLNGLYLVNGSQHVDNQVIVDHAMPYTYSRELYKGILDDRSRSAFHGSIIVREGARKVDAHQVDKNLLLSDEAEADAKPAFWIYCDDVKCGHGAACGQLNEGALFYLRSRGMDERAARGLLTQAFVNDVVDAIACEPVRAHVDAAVRSRLQAWLGV